MRYVLLMALLTGCASVHSTPSSLDVSVLGQSTADVCSSFIVEDNGHMMQCVHLEGGAISDAFMSGLSAIAGYLVGVLL